jgi:hypothetical protein
MVSSWELVWVRHQYVINIRIDIPMSGIGFSITERHQKEKVMSKSVCICTTTHWAATAVTCPNNNVRTPHLKNKVIAGILRRCEMKCVNVTLAQSMMKFSLVSHSQSLTLPVQCCFRIFYGRWSLNHYSVNYCFTVADR